MRIYIIGNDGIRLSGEAPALLNESEIAVASNEELHAAPLSGKRLLALWNALPGVEKRKKVGDRAALIDQLWPAIEALPDPEPQSDARRPSKQDEVIAMLRRAEGATIDEVASATGWRRHTVRGVQFLVRSDGDLALIEYCRCLAEQPDSIIADDIDAHGWVLLAGPAARGRR